MQSMYSLNSTIIRGTLISKAHLSDLFKYASVTAWYTQPAIGYALAWMFQHWIATVNLSCPGACLHHIAPAYSSAKTILMK